jgi:hypothetical protein
MKAEGPFILPDCRQSLPNWADRFSGFIVSIRSLFLAGFASLWLRDAKVPRA